MSAAPEIERCYEREWTDGLPVVPPTHDLVDDFLSAASLEPDTLLGEITERGRPVYAEKVAANAVMAGCRPEYMPVVVAAVRALCEPAANTHVATLSTSGAAPLLIVSGPIVREIGMNAGPNLFGSGNRANATIGRAIRLVVMNVLGGRPGTFDRSAIGHPGKYTFCIAEDEPWEPFHVERGFEIGASVVTLVFSEAPRYVRDDSSADPTRLLTAFVTGVKSCSHAGGTFVVVVNPDHRGVLDAAAWTRERITEFLLRNSTVTVAELKRAARMAGDPNAGDEKSVVAMVRSSEDLIVLAGGGTGVFSAIVPPWAGGRHTRPVSIRVAERNDS